MNKHFFLQDNKYKFFLYSHLLIVGFYIIFTIIMSLKFHKFNLLLYTKCGFYIISNLILAGLIYYKAKYTKLILNLFSGLIFLWLCYVIFDFFYTYFNNLYFANSHYKITIIYYLFIMGFVTFYIFYLNRNNKDQKDGVIEIDEIGKSENLL